MRTLILASVFTTVCVATAVTPTECHDLVHQWGTFASARGSDGIQRVWNPFTVSELPKIVCNLDNPQRAALPVVAKEDEKPPHIVEKTDMQGRMESGLPCTATDDGAVVVKTFFAKMATYPDIRFREFFDPRYLKKYGLTDRDIAFEIVNLQGIESLRVADDNLTVFVVLRVQGGREALITRCVVCEGHIYISPEKAPDPKTGIFKPWILRTRLIEGN